MQGIVNNGIWNNDNNINSSAGWMILDLIGILCIECTYNLFAKHVMYWRHVICEYVLDSTFHVWEFDILSDSSY